MRGTDEITNIADVIDSRDVIERIEYLEGELQSAFESDGANNEDGFEAWLKALAESYDGTGREDEATELLALRALAEEAEGYTSDWQHGEALIRDSYFQEYAQQLAEDVGAINSEARWPNNCIDWERAARELQQDYTAVDFDGVTYWTR